MKNIKDYNLDELQEELINLGEKKFRAEQIFSWIWAKNAHCFDDMTDVKKEFRQFLKSFLIVQVSFLLLYRQSAHRHWHLLMLLHKFPEAYRCSESYQSEDNSFELFRNYI